ncbi:MAG: NTP transferase domain-containing protein [Myxococcales bacterium]|nr:NTP transferase domain-containing protein [Myxococcales bacterium]
MQVPAVIAAGDRRAAKAVRGESKPYLSIAGATLVERAVRVLQAVPEVSEVILVGDAPRLEQTLAAANIEAELTKPLTILPQFQNLYQNAWESYRRLLPGAGPSGRDPESDADADQFVLYLSADLPFATPQEISAFIHQTLATGADYGLGLVTEESMADFYPTEEEPGIRMAYFNLRQGRFRQSNLHLVRPARLGRRHRIEEMYEHRHQREMGQILKLGWRILTSEGGGATVLLFYGLMHFAGVLDRRGHRRLADWLRATIDVGRVERACSRLLDTSFRFVVTEAGGCAVDIDLDEDYETACVRFEDWWPAQCRKAEAVYGPLALPAEARGELRVMPERPASEEETE